MNFLKKGAKRRRTAIRLSDLKAERLKQVPGYVILEAARKHVRLGLEACLVISVAANLVQGCELISLADRLSQKRIALVPSKLDQITEVDVGKIGDRQVYGTLIMYLSLLGTVDAASVDENYRVLKEYMTPELRIQFERETREYKRMVKDEGLSEQMFVDGKKIAIGKDGRIEAEARVRIRPSIGASVGKVREERVAMKMRVITNYEKNQWLLQITELTRAPIDSEFSRRKVE
ncbi:MAG: hypothetical protein AB7G93_13350 [Bdellovibrionales bacterium]